MIRPAFLLGTASLMLSCMTDQPQLNQEAPRIAEKLDIGTKESPARPTQTCQEYTLLAGQTLGHLLGHVDLTRSLQQKLTVALDSHLPSRRIRPGLSLKSCRTNEDRLELRFTKPRATSFLSARLDSNEQWTVEKKKLPLTTRTELIQMTLTHSIGQAVKDAGAQPSLTPLLAEVLAWDMDLRRDVQKGDKINVLVDQLHRSSGEFMKYDRVVALSYRGQSRRFSIFGFESKKGVMRYYDEAGGSVERSLLSTPLRFARISSTFSSKRRHPILGYTKAHNGVDYAAPTGTPVWSVGRGRVSFSGWKGANGKLIKIDHGNGITTAYAHLSKIEKGIKRGTRVEAKQIIGRVGTTGRSTGPHLHFAMKKNGRFVNPLSVKRPRLKSIPAESKVEFVRHVAALKAKLSRPSGLNATEIQ
ncbi:MAG: M23 family metallopeptidase [Bradymonadia bacterium]